MKRWLYAGAVLLLLAAGIGGAVKFRRIQTWTNAFRSPDWSASKLTFRAARSGYPFSLVPGGVRDWKELSDSAVHDPVVRRHYHDVRLEGLYPARTTAPMMVYVSYRVGDDVRWTQKKLRIPRGELVLTDGRNVIRGRCGNRVLELPPPMAGTTPPPVEDPPEIVFETPGPPLIPQPPNDAPVLVELAVSQPPVPPTGPLVTPTGPPVTPTGPLILPPEPPVTPAVVWPPIGPPITPPLPPVAVTPEPGTWMLFVSGMGLLAALKWRLRKSTQLR